MICDAHPVRFVRCIENIVTEERMFRDGQLHPEPARHLVAHAGVAVLHVVALRVAGPPQLVQVAGQRAGRADDDVPRPGHVVDHADHFTPLGIVAESHALSHR